MSDPAWWLKWKTVEVDGRPAAYGEAGEGGPTVLFLHGWGLDHRAYKRALSRLVALRMHVVAPALPGFGGTARLAEDPGEVSDYARWLERFLDALGVGKPVLVMGHSFGGGVAIALAHGAPARVRGLVLVNSIGAAAWSEHAGTMRSGAQRPLWDWGLHLPDDLWPLRQARRVLPVVAAEAAANLVRDPRSFVAMARLARRADLTAELEELKRRRLPVVVLWGERDRLVTRHAFDEMCRLLGRATVVTVEGTHAWLIADPDTFGEVMSNVVGIFGPLHARPRRLERLRATRRASGDPAALR